MRRLLRKRNVTSNPKKFDKCVKAVKKRGGAANAYAVCTAAERKNRARRTKKSDLDPEQQEYRGAVEASEEFHGRPPSEIIEVETEVFEHEHLGDLGELVKLEIIGVHGGVIDLEDFDGARLAQSPKGYNHQLYIEGGDQTVDLEEFGIRVAHESEVLGYLKYVTYYTVKDHLGRDGGEANYRHKFNDGQKIRIGTKRTNRPTVLYDVNNHLLSIAGGEYEILPEGIDN